MIKSKVKKMIATSLIVVASLAFFTTSSYAYDPNLKKDRYFGGNIVTGLDRPVWYSPSVSSYGYTGAFDVGRTYWNKDTKANLWRSDQVNNSTDRYYVGTSYGGDLDTTGRTTPYRLVNGKAVLAETDENWNFSVVTIYNDAFKKKRWFGFSYRAMDADEIRKTAAHEVGHSVKIAHNLKGTLETVMRQGIFDIPSTTIRLYDKQSMESKWGK